MGFIERIAEAMKPTPSPEQVTPETRQMDEEPQTEQANETESGDGTETPEEKTDSREKTYSEKEMEELFEERKKEWESERLNSLSKESQIEELKTELLKRDLKDKVNARLDEAKLPLGIAEFVQYSDEAGTMASLEKVITTVNQLVQDGVMMRLRGKTPEGLGAAVDTRTTPAFAKAFLDAMKN